MTVYGTSVADAVKYATAKSHKGPPPLPAATAARDTGRSAGRPSRTTKGGTSSPSDPTPADTEDPRDRKNRLARERRQRKKQEILDAQAGVTLATGTATPVQKDPSAPVHTPPADPVAVGARLAPQNGHGGADRNGTVRPRVSMESGDDGTLSTVDPDDAPAPSPPPAKKARTRRAWPRAPSVDDTIAEPPEPPKWYTNLLTEVIRTKITEAGEKASKKAIKESGGELAKERWADPAERERTRAHQDRLYNQMFR